MEERPEIGVALAELAAAFSGLVKVVTDDGHVQLTSRRIEDVAARVMPGCRHVGVVVVEDGKARTLASTDAVAAQVDAIQFHCGEGPALDVLVTDGFVHVDDLANDARWPEFAKKALEVGDVRSMTSYLLHLGRRRQAVLSFYSTWPYAFDDIAVAIGAMFGAYCSLDLVTQQLGDKVRPRRAAAAQQESAAR